MVHSSEEETETGDSTVILEEEGRRDPGKTEVLSRPRTRLLTRARIPREKGYRMSPAGQEGTNARESEGTPAAAQENQGTDSGTAGGSGTEESAGTAGGSSVKIE